MQTQRMSHSIDTGFSFRRIFSFSLVIPAVLALGVSVAQASTLYWVGPSNGVWSTAANWSLSSGGAGGDGPPISTDTAIFDDGGTNNAAVDATFAGTVGAVLVATNYPGSITQERDLDVSGDFALSNGVWTFVAGLPAELSVDGDMTVASELRCPYSSLAGEGTGRVFTVGQTLTVASNGWIHADGMGFPEGQGPGAPVYFSSGYRGAGGGGHGGRGGYGVGNHGGYGGGSSYGSLREPVALGSGGGRNGDEPAGPGGGAIRISASEMLIQGRLSAEGGMGNKGVTSNYRASGGGAGGSIWIDASTFSGNGLVSSAGGDGAGDGIHSGGGSGGRIAVYSATNGFSGLLSSYGGDIGFIEGAARRNAGPGAPGTIFHKLPTQTFGEVTIDGGGVFAGYRNDIGARLPAGTQRFDRITVRNRGCLEIHDATVVLDITDTELVGDGSLESLIMCHGEIKMPSDYTLTHCTIGLNPDAVVDGLENLTIGPGGILTHSPSTTNPNTGWKTNMLVLSLGNLTVQAGGKIDASGQGFSPQMGYLPAAGPGNGEDGSNYHGGGGGGHGGFGGHNSNNNRIPTRDGGSYYGRYAVPVLPGSSGGSCGASTWDVFGGAAGGAIRVVATNIVLDGWVAANGLDGTNFPNYWASGGGSGGGIRLISDSLSGTGTVQAIGGLGGNQSHIEGGGGSGGRIAIEAKTYGYTGSIGAYAGQGRENSQDGAAGTIYLRTNSMERGDLFIANNNLAYPAITILSESLTNNLVNDVAIFDDATVSTPEGQELQVYGSWTNVGVFAAASNSVVTLAGPKDAAVYGDNTFWSLSATHAGKTVTFESGATNTLRGHLELREVSLGATEEGVQTFLNLDAEHGTQDVGGVSVRDNNASPGQTIIADYRPEQSINEGNNVNWLFPGPPGSLIMLR